jgi:hypothetical protein
LSAKISSVEASSTTSVSPLRTVTSQKAPSRGASLPPRPICD